MAYLRFGRDKRGYEHTSLVHPIRRHGRSEPRVLYWFRTPPYVKVGRAPLDDEAKRLLEESHPDVAFDWNRILREPPQQLPETEAVKRRERRDSRDARRKRRRPSSDATGAAGLDAAEPPEDLVEPADEETAGGADDLGAGGGEAEPEPSEEAEGGADDVEPAAAPEEDVDAEGIPPSRIASATSELVGVEGAARLHNRYVVLMQRISRVPDEAKREQLRAEAAGLNPDAWETVEVARAALDTFEARYEALRAQVGAGGRRGRRRPRRK